MFPSLPAEAADWVREDKIPQPPAEYSETLRAGSASDNLAVVSPAPYEYVGQNVNIIGNARAGAFRSYKLAYGSSLQPSSFSQIGPDHGNQVSNGTAGRLGYDRTGWPAHPAAQRDREQTAISGSCRLPVFVDNVTPTIKITYPYTDDTFIAIKEGDNDKLRIQADASDNVAMGRVEFYMDGSAAWERAVCHHTTSFGRSC